MLNQVSLKSICFQQKHLNHFDLILGAAIYSSDEDDSDLETRRSKKIDKGKALKALRESDDEDDDEFEVNSGSGSEHEKTDTRERSVPRGNQIESDEED